MSDKYEQLKKNIVTYRNLYETSLFTATLDSTRLAIIDLQEENTSLITTIESLQGELKAADDHEQTLKHAFLVRESINEKKFYDKDKQIESLKAITELAMTTLKDILHAAQITNLPKTAEIIESTFSKIERLKNA